MTNESNVEKLARLYTEKLARLYDEEGFTKEQMAEEMFNNGAAFADVVRVARKMKG